MSGDVIGTILLGSSAFPLWMGWSLSSKGLDKAQAASTTIAEAASAMQDTVANQQLAIAAASGDEAVMLANATQTVAEAGSAATKAADDVSSALAAMTGPLAPARVAFSIAVLLIVSALGAYGVIEGAINAA